MAKTCCFIGEKFYNVWLDHNSWLKIGSDFPAQYCFQFTQFRCQQGTCKTHLTTDLDPQVCTWAYLSVSEWRPAQTSWIWSKTSRLYYLRICLPGDHQSSATPQRTNSACSQFEVNHHSRLLAQRMHETLQ